MANTSGSFLTVIKQKTVLPFYEHLLMSKLTTSKIRHETPSWEILLFRACPFQFTLIFEIEACPFIGYVNKPLDLLQR